MLSNIYVWLFIASVFTSLVGYSVRNVYSNICARIEALEGKSGSLVTEQAVRTIIADKVDPLQEDITEIKSDVKNLFVRMIDSHIKN